MFAIATILPVERVIFNTNLFLAQKVDSRIDFAHLSLLSADVLSVATNAVESERLDETYWQPWLAQRVKNSCHRSWFEVNLSLIINCRSASAYIELEAENLTSDAKGYIR